MTYVYALRDSAKGRIKVGYSSHPRERVRVVGDDSMSLVAVVSGTRAVERELHRELSVFALGGEWFHDVPQVMEALSRRGFIPLEDVPAERPAKSRLIRAELSDDEYAEIRKEAIDRQMTTATYLTALIRSGRNHHQ